MQVSSKILGWSQLRSDKIVLQKEKVGCWLGISLIYLKFPFNKRSFNREGKNDQTSHDSCLRMIYAPLPKAWPKKIAHTKGIGHALPPHRLAINWSAECRVKFSMGDPEEIMWGITNFGTCTYLPVDNVRNLVQVLKVTAAGAASFLYTRKTHLRTTFIRNRDLKKINCYCRFC